MSVTHRLQQFLTHKNITVYAFEIRIGAGKNVIQRAIKNGTSFNVKMLELAGAKYPELNMHWLVTGHGSMLLGDAPAVVDCAEYERENYELLRENRALRLELEALKKSTATVTHKS